MEQSKSTLTSKQQPVSMGMWPVEVALVIDQSTVLQLALNTFTLNAWYTTLCSGSMYNEKCLLSIIDDANGTLQCFCFSQSHWAEQTQQLKGVLWQVYLLTLITEAAAWRQIHYQGVKVNCLSELFTKTTVTVCTGHNRRVDSAAKHFTIAIDSRQHYYYYYPIILSPLFKLKIPLQQLEYWPP